MQLSSDSESTAAQIVNEHGLKAPQHVVDQIVAAVREGDLARAKLWEAIGQAIDRRLAS